MTALRTLFQAMADEERRQDMGQLPGFVSAEDGYFFDIGWEDDALCYGTKWIPNTHTLILIARFMGVGFIHSYSEPDNGIHGEATYENGHLTDICLEDDDWAAYHYDEENQMYLFENEAYDSSELILDILLERKKAIKSLTS
ncbi:hypothetical protein ABDD95_07650 [Mucilaginibacter sp. PAMB04274]|uniref:DUF1281 family ferredoxin-like fold protein n=1 Tax=Mucilaginibacter sp. PAMB04274 TaxID=3138568 RepID=UPI0031F6B2C7